MIVQSTVGFACHHLLPLVLCNQAGVSLFSVPIWSLKALAVCLQPMPPTPQHPQEKFGKRRSAWRIVSELDHTNVSWRGTVEGIYFTPDLLWVCADRKLLTRGRGLGGRRGYKVYPAVETQADVCADIAVIFSYHSSVSSGGQWCGNVSADTHVNSSSILLSWCSDVTSPDRPQTLPPPLAWNWDQWIQMHCLTGGNRWLSWKPAPVFL